MVRPRGWHLPEKHIRVDDKCAPPPPCTQAGGTPVQPLVTCETLVYTS